VNPLRNVTIHAGLLLLGGVAAGFAWSKDKTPHSTQETNVVVWNARPSDISRIVHETKGKRLELEAREEKKGGERWYFGKVEYPPVPGSNPMPTMKPAVFASVGPATKVVEAFAPFKALRSLGKVPPSREAEFGFDKKEASLTFTVSGKERKLFIGGIAPGAGDTYVLDSASNEAYVLKSDPLRDIEGGETRLLERDQHAFKEPDIAQAKITAGGKTRVVVRSGPDNKRIWADPADKEKADETVANWMQKIDHLRVNEFAANPPAGQTVVLRVEYEGSGKSLGYFELSKSPAADPSSSVKNEYWIMTEHTHLPGKLLPSAGEGVEQDLTSVLK
jgi:hypothetical protein